MIQPLIIVTKGRKGIIMETTNYNSIAELCYYQTVVCLKTLMEIQKKLELLNRIQETLDNWMNQSLEDDCLFLEEFSEALYYSTPIIQNEINELLSVIRTEHKSPNGLL